MVVGSGYCRLFSLSTTVYAVPEKNVVSDDITVLPEAAAADLF